MLNVSQNFTKLSSIILKTAIETEMNGGLRKNWGPRELNCSPTLEIIF